jgi:phasin
MIETPVDKAINERAEVAAMLARAVGTPLICVKAFCYSARGMVMSTPPSASAQSLPISGVVMSDANLSADKIREMLAEANGRLRKASAEYFDLLEKGLSSSQLPVADQAKQYCGYLQRNVTATFDLGDRLIQAKDMQDAAKIQSEFFQDQMRSLTDHARSMGESAMKAATGVFTPKS